MSEQHSAHVQAWDNFKFSRLASFAHKSALEIASQKADPILNPRNFQTIYWTVMGGYGFRPYIPGMPSHYYC